MLNPQTAAACLLSVALAAAVGGCDASPSPAEAVPAATTAADLSARPRPKLFPGAKTRVLEPAGDREFDKTFDDLRFDIAVGAPFRREMLTESINALAGKQMRIRGFILPTPQKRGIKQFVLVRDNLECCFGPGAALFDCILVDMNEGATAEYTIRPVAVSGIFDIQEVVVDGRHLAIYHIAGDSVE